MGRNNADFAHEQTIQNLSYNPTKFDRKMNNALGFKEVNGARTSVRTAPKVAGDSKSGTVLRAASSTTGKSAEAKMPTRKRDVNKAVGKLRKEVSK